jgi:hypothetical protein
MRYDLGESALLPTSGRDDSTREHLSSVEATTVLTATTTDEVENYTANAPTIVDCGRHRGQAVGFRPKAAWFQRTLPSWRICPNEHPGPAIPASLAISAENLCCIGD